MLYCINDVLKQPIRFCISTRPANQKVDIRLFYYDTENRENKPVVLKHIHFIIFVFQSYKMLCDIGISLYIMQSFIQREENTFLFIDFSLSEKTSCAMFTQIK